MFSDPFHIISQFDLQSGARVVLSPDEEVVAISKKSQVIRTGVNEIATLRRQTQEVRIMKLREGDSIASLTCL